MGEIREFRRDAHEETLSLAGEQLGVIRFDPIMRVHEYWMRRAVQELNDSEPYEYFEVLGLVVTEKPGAGPDIASPVRVTERGIEHILAERVDESKPWLRDHLASCLDISSNNIQFC